jgi:A/G-specific adenine glycosylase
VSDRELKEIVMQTVDSEHPREWYWALMDYGSFLKKNGAGKIDKSSHYKKQPQFIGSLREVRGQILKLLSLTPVSESELKRKMPTDERYEVALMALLKENLVTQTGDRLHLTQ